MAGCRGAGCSQTSGSDSWQQPRASWHLLFYAVVTLGWLAAAAIGVTGRLEITAARWRRQLHYDNNNPMTAVAINRVQFLWLLYNFGIRSGLLPLHTSQTAQITASQMPS